MRQFLIALLLVWTAACIGAYFYSQNQDISASVTGAVLPALLMELALYLVPGFAEVRKRFEAIPSRTVRAGLLTASAVVPYIAATIPLGRFNPVAFLLLLALAGAASFWYAALPRSAAADLGFLAFMAVVYAVKTFAFLYPKIAPRASLDILGQLMWIRVGLLAVLSIRRFESVRFGFIPSPREWKVGFEQYVLFLPVGALLAFGFRFMHFQLRPVPWWKYVTLAVATFLGVLWVVAVAEEFFFRGFLQQLLARSLRSQVAGLIIASVLFGAVHLWFRVFPNWRFAIVAAVAGLFYGAAFMRTGSVRASMVTHAFVVSTWRLFFA